MKSWLPHKCRKVLTLQLECKVGLPQYMLKCPFSKLQNVPVSIKIIIYNACEYACKSNTQEKSQKFYLKHGCYGDAYDVNKLQQSVDSACENVKKL